MHDQRSDEGSSSRPARPGQGRRPGPSSQREVASSKRPAGSPSSAGDRSSPEDGGGLGRVVVRNEFYRDGYRLTLRIALIQSFVILGLIGAMFFFIYVHQPEDRYFATTEDGRLIPMVPLNEPNLSSPALLSWAAQAASETMSFSFSNYRRNLQQSSRYFTRKGWQSFTSALQKSQIIDSIEHNAQEITAVPAGAPILKSQGVVNGQFQWVVQIPMVLTTVSGSTSRSENWMITVVIVRVPRLESPNGVGIAQWLAVRR